MTTIQDRTKVAASFKAKGNSAYQGKNFEEAAELYTKAIQVSPKPEPVFYSNRAACKYITPRFQLCCI